MDDYYSRITGKLLGDGCITKQKNRRPRFQFMHRMEDWDWGATCYEKLNNWIPLNSPYYKISKDHRVKKGYSESCFVQSKTSPIIDQLEQTWYRNRKKTLPMLFIEQYLNEESLAWWYQDDGHLSIVDGKVKKIVLSTDSFTVEEN